MMSLQTKTNQKRQKSADGPDGQEHHRGTEEGSRRIRQVDGSAQEVDAYGDAEIEIVECARFAFA